MARISPDVHMRPCHVNCHANVKYHAPSYADRLRKVVALHVYILPQHGPAVNITLPHAQVEYTPTGKHAQKSARERGLRFWVELGLLWKMWNHFTKYPSIKATSRGGSYVTKCNPAHAPLWGLLQVRQSISSEGPNLPTHTYIYTYDLL